MSRLPRHTHETPVVSVRGGFVSAIDGREVGLVGVSLGAGRMRAQDPIDPIVGFRVDKKVGERVEVGEALVTILHGGKPDDVLAMAQARLLAAFTVTEHAVQPRPLILERIG